MSRSTPPSLEAMCACSRVARPCVYDAAAIEAADAVLLLRWMTLRQYPSDCRLPGAPEPTQGGPGRVTLALRRPLAAPRRYLPVRRCYIA